MSEISSVTVEQIDVARASALRIATWGKRDDSPWLRFVRRIENRIWHEYPNNQFHVKNQWLPWGKYNKRLYSINRRINRLTSIDALELNAIKLANVELGSFCLNNGATFTTAHHCANYFLKSVKLNDACFADLLEPELNQLSQFNVASGKLLLQTLYLSLGKIWRSSVEWDTWQPTAGFYRVGIWSRDPRCDDEMFLSEPDHQKYVARIMTEWAHARRWIMSQPSEKMTLERISWFEQFTDLSKDQLRQAAARYENNSECPRLRKGKSGRLNTYCVEDALAIWPHLMKSVTRA